MRLIACLCALPFWFVSLAVMGIQTPVRVNIPADQPLPDCDSGLPHGRYLPRLLRVVVNGTDSRLEPVFLQRPCGALLARAADLEALRIKTATLPRVSINGEPYLNLNVYDGLVYVLDESRQQLAIEGEPRIFHPTVLDLAPPVLPPAPRAPSGAFLNYGLFAAGPTDGSAQRWNANAGLGVFGSPGVLLSDWLYSRAFGIQNTFRLSTTFVRDIPRRVATLRVGDVFARPGGFGGGAMLGGVQYGTNFATRPGLQITPVRMMEAATRAAAGVDLYVSDLDDPERESRAVFLSGLTSAPHGPVELINLPTYSNGQYELVLRDRFGREASVSQEFFFNQGLLRQGLHDYSYEAGLLRTSIIDDRYDNAYLSGTHRYGVNATFTAEAHAEAAETGYAAGLTGAWAVPYLGVVVATAAGSDSDFARGPGAMAALGVENQYRRYAYALREECRDSRFVLPAETTASDVACSIFGLVSGTLPWNDSLALSASYSDRRSASDAQALRLSYSTRLLRSAQLQLYTGWSDSGTESYNAGLLFSMSFAATRLGTYGGLGGLFDPRRTHFDLIANHESEGRSTAFGRVSSNAGGADNVYSAQIGAALDQRDLQTLSATWTGGRFSAVAALQNSEGTETYSAGGASAIAWMDGELFASRPLFSSFALVRMGEDYAGARVNGLRSNGDGDVLISPLQPYYENSIRVNSGDLPANTRAESLSFTVRPRFRSGVVLRPGIRIVRDALLTVELMDPEGGRVPLPPGAYARVPNSEEQFPVGEDGLLYVSELDSSTSLTVHYRGQECAITIQLPEKPTVNTIPELGTFLCEGVAP